MNLITGLLRCFYPKTSGEKKQKGPKTSDQARQVLKNRRQESKKEHDKRNETGASSYLNFKPEGLGQKFWPVDAEDKELLDLLEKKKSEK